MIKTPTRQITLAEFLQLPETKPASEYINGEIIQKPMPQGKHSRIQGELVTTINNVVKPRKIALAFPELRCTFGERSIVPDVAVFAWGRIPVDDTGNIANVFNTYPDWTIEILSPQQNTTKVTRNILHCLNHGTSLGWLIDPEEYNVLIYPHNQQPIFLENEQDILPVPELIGDLQLTLGQLFDCLKL
ncbi:MULTISPECIES: Uma2 family endonuclease [Cyanophyceae]|uniref:Uma2 family endonuclease n=2 Tax=Cyanobacteriota TaxID=1117 RepID=UPI0023308401|nr:MULTISPECIES: Uma2 family endonuclease [Cyanophyceae]MDB9355646.1 Uma2 family endonuclease [Nodularia spumigena CS-587/03]MDB9305263.1 Uma2 family endonuclease [Nodularia spumigena CS-591/12]MDB9318740.1 Uma2 family endonuclease [Nodularia spumigena CS-590/01A]MDB9327195.1 Uma2 family endonuclease [Nodularia spumigena CS-590/02]MDB9340301.1 Uma2 family endonuclease [Nodularia spumigena CS-589/07]